MPKPTIETEQERNTILAALRLWQSIKPKALSRDLLEIATDGTSTPMMTQDEIDDLCIRLNVGIE